MLYRHLTRYRWSIAALTAVATAAAIYFSFRQPPVYEADTSVLVEPIVPIGETSAVLPAQNLTTEARLAASIPVAEGVASALGLSESADDLLRHLTVDRVSETEILEFRYDHGDPRVAARRSQAFAEQYLRFRRQQAVRDASNASDAVQDDIASIEQELSVLSEEISAAEPSLKPILRSRATLLNTLLVNKKLDAIRLQGELRTGRIVEQAEVPTTPVRPNHRMNALLGMVLGLFLGTGQAVLRGGMNRQIWSIEELEGLAGAPVLGVIPSVRDWRRRHATLLTDDGARWQVVEAFRALRENVAAVASAGDARALLVTSAEGEEGRSTIAANLAIAFARAGRRVTLVAADSRRSAVDVLLGVSSGPGLVEVLSGEVPVADALIPHTSGIRILPHGRREDAPVEVVGAGARRLLDELRSGADYVILDTAPLSGSADAVALAPTGDGVILVVDMDRADASVLRSVRRQLGQIGVPLLGAVLNRANLRKLAARSFRVDATHGIEADASAEDGGRIMRTPAESPR